MLRSRTSKSLGGAVVGRKRTFIDWRRRRRRKLTSDDNDDVCFFYVDDGLQSSQLTHVMPRLLTLYTNPVLLFLTSLLTEAELLEIHASCLRDKHFPKRMISVCVLNSDYSGNNLAGEIVHFEQEMSVDQKMAKGDWGGGGHQ